MFDDGLDSVVPIAQYRVQKQTVKPKPKRKPKPKPKPEPKKEHPAKSESISLMVSLGYEKREAVKLFDDLSGLHQFDTVEEFAPILMRFFHSKK